MHGFKTLDSGLFQQTAKNPSLPAIFCLAPVHVVSPLRWRVLSNGCAVALGGNFEPMFKLSAICRRVLPSRGIATFLFCSYTDGMQIAFDFGAVDDMEWVREQLRFCFGLPERLFVLTPIGQLVKSLISNRTRDEVSLAAYRRLVEAYPQWAALAKASTADVESLIGNVTFPNVKARHLGEALRAIAVRHPDFDPEFLGHLSVAEALAWLERLPGVGRKVSASTLNFSTLNMPAFVIDTHILRVLRRYGFVRSKAETRAAYDAMMAVLPRWSAAELVELHILMKRLGQTICRYDRARCPDCPIRRRCKSASVRRPAGVARRNMDHWQGTARE